MSSPSTDTRRRCVAPVAWSILLAVSINACRSASGYHGPPTPLLDRSFVAPSVDKRDTLLFEAQMAANIFLLDNLLEQERDLRDDQFGQRRVAYRLIVAPTFRIRQLSDSSAAVRTASFMPSLFFEQHWLSADTVPRVAHADKALINRIIDLGYRLGWTHHSNGQAGCFFAGYVSDASGDPDNCTPGPNADTTGVGLNRSSGDFSTTYWSVTGFARRIQLHRNQEENWVIEGALGYQLHKFGIFGDMRPEQRALYGTHRGRLDVSLRKDYGPVQARVDGLVELAEHTDPRIKNWRAHLDISARARRLLGTGAFVRFLDGQDYYNIGFANRRTRILFGLILDPSSLESLRQ